MSKNKMIHHVISEPILQAYDVLEGKKLSPELALELGKVEGTALLDLISLANKVRVKFAKNQHICTILNARSGKCSENCRFCAQSSHNNAEIDKYELLDKAVIIKHAYEAYNSGVRSFGIVTSGFGFTARNDSFESILQVIAEIKHQLPDLNVCASLGILSAETTELLAKEKLSHYNINIQTNTSRFKELIATTHPIEERIATIRLLKTNGIKVCSGGILGLGESMEDRIAMAFTLNDLEVDVIPLNVLIPIPGTPLSDKSRISAAETAKTFAIFRLINPNRTIKFAAGRETLMNDFQGLLMLAGANGMLTGGYLTTRGRNVKSDMLLQKELELFQF